MAAQWRRLTEYLDAAADDVYLPWDEFDRIVGGVPDSAIDHYPQWWHGDRPNTRAWRAAGYDAAEIKPGVSVSFRATGEREAATGHAVDSSPSDQGPAVLKSGTKDSPASLQGLDPVNCLFIVPCSGAKQSGGSPDRRQVDIPESLAAARRAVLATANLHDDLLMPAWRRYTGHFYRTAGSALAVAAENGRLLIMSGGYGLLDGQEAIGTYDQLMKPGQWPRGLLEQHISDRATSSGLHVVAFLASTTGYAKILRRVDWRLPTGRSAVLVSASGIRGVSAVSRTLGHGFAAFNAGRELPADMVAEPLA